MDKLDPLDIEFLINSEEVKADAKKVKDDIKGIGDAAEAAAAKVNGVGSGGGIAAPLGAAGNAAEVAGKKAAAARPQWNGLGNSINQISRELPAFTYSAQTGFLALSNNIPILADEIGRLKAKNDALVASGQKGVPVWKQVLKGLISWQTALSLGVALLTIYGKEVGDWIGSLFKGKEALDEHKKSVEALNKAYESSEYQKVIKDMMELRSMINLAKEGFIDKKTALDKYNKSMGEVYEKTDDLNEAERIMVEKAPAYIESMLYKTAATMAAADAAKALAENAKKVFELNEEKDPLAADIASGKEAKEAANSRSGFVSPNMQSQKVAEINKELAELEKGGNEIQDKSAKIVESLNQKAAEIAKAAGLDIFGNKDDDDKNKDKIDKYIGQRKDLLEKVADLDREYARKKLDKDDEELQALRDKFLKVRELIEEFNRDPKNTTRKIDVSGLGVIQENAEADLIYKQETRSLKEELEKQKKLYREIEEYKAKFGIEKTREKYGEDLKAFDDYAAVIRQKLVNNFDASTAVDNGTATAAQNARITYLKNESLEEQRLASDKYAALLEEYMAYQEKRKLLQERFKADYDALILGGDFDQADVVKEIYEKELAVLDDANLKKKDSYKKLFEDVGRLTIAAGKKIIASAKMLLETEQMSAETQAKILKLIVDTEEKIEDLQEEKILRIAFALGELGNSLKGLGDEIGSSALSDIGGFLAGMASGVEDLMTALSDDATDVEKLEVAVKAMVKLMNIISSASAQRRSAEEAYYRSVIGFQNDYNLSLQEQIRLQSELKENAWIKDYEGRLRDGIKSLKNDAEQYGEALEALNGGRAKTGQRNAIDWGNVGQGAIAGATLGATIGSVVPVIGNLVGGIIGGIAGALGGLFGGKKKKSEWGNLLGEYPELLQEVSEGVFEINRGLAESLLANDLLDESTQQLVQNALDWQKAIEESRAQIREIIVDLTGSLGDDLRMALVDAFESGEDAAVAMGGTVEKVLENILSNMLFNRIFTDAFDKLEEQMAASFDTGGDSSWVDDFSRFFNEASGLTDDFNQALRDAQTQAAGFGFDIFKPDEDDSQPNGLQGAIRRELTEETGSELTGLFRGQYDITKRHFQLHEMHFELERRHFDATMRIMQYSALIEQNTLNTVVQLQYAVAELKVINTNTKPSQTARDIGRG